jgi:hypothetical protein
MVGLIFGDGTSGAVSQARAAVIESYRLKRFDKMMFEYPAG